MYISGEWLECDDGVVRPVVRGEIRSADGTWQRAEFLVDSGGDVTLFSENVAELLDLEPVATGEPVSGIGGTTETHRLRTEIRLTRENQGKVLFRGEFAAFTDPTALDMSVLGRDVTDRFAVILDRPGDVVCILGERHYYRIQQR